MNIHYFFTAICLLSCRNGGKCVRHNKCKCPRGYRGRDCSERKYVQNVNRFNLVSRKDNYMYFETSCVGKPVRCIHESFLSNNLSLFLQDFVNLKVTQLLIGYNGLSNQKLYFFQVLLNLENLDEQG